MIFIWSLGLGPDLKQSTKSFRMHASSPQSAQYRLLLQLPTNAWSWHITTTDQSQLYPEYLWPYSSRQMLKLIPNQLLLFPHLAARRAAGRAQLRILPSPFAVRCCLAQISCHRSKVMYTFGIVLQ